VPPINSHRAGQRCAYRRWQHLGTRIVEAILSRVAFDLVSHSVRKALAAAGMPWYCRNLSHNEHEWVDLSDFATAEELIIIIAALKPHSVMMLGNDIFEVDFNGDGWIYRQMPKIHE